ncbi:hypothetical protein BH24CHL3_BH24CHL3_09140 [soil metagenome]
MNAKGPWPPIPGFSKPTGELSRDLVVWPLLARAMGMSSGWREPNDDPHICPGSVALGIVVVEPGECFVDVDLATLEVLENAKSLRIRLVVVW